MDGDRLCTADQVTGNLVFRDAARTNFDLCYARAWSTNLGGGLCGKLPTCSRTPVSTGQRPLFPRLVSASQPGYVFLFFCGMMVLQLIWVKTLVIETKGVSLEQIQKRLGY